MYILYAVRYKESFKYLKYCFPNCRLNKMVLIILFFTTFLYLLCNNISFKGRLPKLLEIFILWLIYDIILISGVQHSDMIITYATKCSLCYASVVVMCQYTNIILLTILKYSLCCTFHPHK